MLSVHLSLGTDATDAEYAAAARLCEYYGFRVTSTERESGDAISADYLADCDVVIANLRKKEIGEPDFRVIFDLGIAHARRKKLYGYMPDSSDYIHRYPYGYLGKNGIPMDQYGLRYATARTLGNLMYSVPTKIIDGGLERCVKAVWYDWIEASKERGQRITPQRDRRFSRCWKKGDAHLAYLAGYECFYENREEIGARMVRLCRRNGFEADYPTSPIDGLRKVEFADLMNPLVGIGASFDHDQYKVLLSDIIIANLNPYHGLLPDSGTVFELGMAVGLGQLCVAFFSSGADVLREQMPKNHGWLVDRRQYDPDAYERRLRALFGSNTAYVRGAFPDAVRFVRRKLRKL